MVEPRLLAVLAHPDDESFGLGGTLARYARQGIEVHVCIVTDGAAGSYAADRVSVDEDPAAEGPPLNIIRRQELACACQVLGARLHTLDYRDSGMAGLADNHHPDCLYQADIDDVATDILRVIREVRPHVVITHDPSGGYHHPDHIKVNHAVLRGWEKASQTITDAGAHAGLRPPARLYYSVIPRSALKWFLRIIRLLRQDPRRFGQNKDIDLTRVGVPDEEIHVRLDVRPYVAIKEQASGCHKSQGGGGALRVVPGFVRRRFFGYEYFALVRPEGAGIHNDLFEGLDFAE